MQSEFHEFASMFPLMEGSEFDELIADIKAHGQREIIVMLDGKVLDGRNRFLACKRLGIKPRMREFQCVDGEPIDFVWSANVTRRHLTEGQRGIAIALRAKFLARGGSPDLQRAVEAISQQTYRINPDASGKILSIREGARLAKISPRTMGRARVIAKYGTKEEIAAVVNGKKGLANIEVMVNARRGPEARNTIGTGCKIMTNQDRSIEDVIKEGLELEKKEILTTEEAAKRVQISSGIYRKARSIVLLSQRKDLSQQDVKLIRETLNTINRTRSVTRHYEAVRHIVDRIWGSHEKTAKRERSKVEDFFHSTDIIVHSCMAKLDVPQLTPEQVDNVLEQLTEASNNITNLITSIRRIYRNGERKHQA